MNLCEGLEFKSADPAKVVTHLCGLERKNIITAPELLEVDYNGGEVSLRVTNGSDNLYPIRKSFMYKILNWYHFQKELIPKLSMKTIVCIANDFIRNIKSREVNIKIENGEALTITSQNYTEFSDLMVIDLAKEYGIESISRNDFFMRLYVKKVREIEPIPGEVFAFGFNIFNSETGFRALSVIPYLLRYTCSNGALINETGTAKTMCHFGYKSIEMKEYLTTEFQKTEKSIGNISNGIQELTKHRAKEFTRKLIPSLDRMMFRTEREVLLKKLKDNATGFDLYNIITTYAKNFEIGKQLYLEQLAGKLLTMLN